MSDPQTQAAINEIARRQKAVEDAIEKIARTPQLRRSSIDAGAINVYDAQGQLSAVVGQQYDGAFGAYAVAGPKPPTPAGLTVESVPGGVLVHWDGTWIQTDADRLAGRPTVAPTGFVRVEVHVSDDSALTGTFADTMRDDITSPRGGDAFIPWTTPSTPLYARLTARTDAGKASDPSAIVGPVVSGLIGLGDLGFDIESYAGGTTITTQATEPTNPAPGDIWHKEVGLDANGVMQYEVWRWTGAEWKLSIVKGISDALADAAAAAGAADQAGIDALAAQSTANTAQSTANTAQSTANTAATAAQTAKNTADTAIANAATAQATADGKVTTYFQTAPPTGLVAGDVGDLWFDTDDGNKMYRWTGSAWAVSDDTRISAALTAAQSANTAVATKTTTYSQPGQPPTTGRVTGDLWVDTDDNNKIYTWNGTAWTLTQLGVGAVVSARTLGAVTTWRQSAAPSSGMIVGDLWIDSDDNKLYQYTATGWVASQDTGIQQALTAAGTAQTTADSKIVTLYSGTAPSSTGRTLGDLWVDTANGNRLSRWNGSSWVLIQDAAIATAQAAAVAANNLATLAKSTADSKVIVYRQAAAPTGQNTTTDVNNLWIDTSSAGAGKLYAWTGTAWVLSDDQRIATALTTAQGKTTIFAQDTQPATTGRTVGDVWIDTSTAGQNRQYVWLANNQWNLKQIGAAAISATARQLGAIQVYRQTATPDGSSTPPPIAGDFWIRQPDNVIHIYVAGAWAVSQDTNINTALTNAAGALSVADSKMRIFTQATFPTGLNITTDLGDMLIKTDEGNAHYTWTFVPGSPAVAAVAGQPFIPARTNLVANSSFEAQAAQTFTTGVAPTSWAAHATGTTGTITRSIVTGGTLGTKMVRAVAASLAIATGSHAGVQQVITGFTAGDVVRAAATVSVTTAVSTSFPVEFFLEFLNSSSAVVGSAVATGTGSTGVQTLNITTSAAPTGTTQIRISVYRRGSGAGSALTNADINIDGVLVEKNVAAGTPTTFIETSDPGQPFIASSPAVAAVPDSGAWTKRALSTGAFQPNSIVAKDVLALGTISGPLFEGEVFLGSAFIADNGGPMVTRFDPVGIRAFADDPVDGIPNEVARFGQSSGGRDPVTGRFTWQIDEQGVISASQIISDNADPVFGGTSILQRDWERPWGLVGYAYVEPFVPGAFTQAIPDELGICELAFNAVPGREYRISHDAFEISTDWAPSNTNLGERASAAIRARLTTDGTAPLTNTPNIILDRLIGDVKADYSSEIAGEYLIGGPAVSARNPGESFQAWRNRQASVPWRILLSFGALPAKNNDGTVGLRYIRMGRFTAAKAWIEDVGPQRANIGRLTSGLPASNPNPAPPAPTPKTTRTVDYPVTWSGSWPESNGFSASHRNGWIYQGYSNGNDAYGAQAGAWGWDQGLVRSDLQGAEINRVEIYMYAYHWWFNAGGTARIGWNRGTGTAGAFPGNNEWFQRDFARGQGQWIDITGWGWRLPLAANDANNMTGIGVGVGGDHNLQFYGYFGGVGDVAGRYPALRVTFTK